MRHHYQERNEKRNNVLSQGRRSVRCGWFRHTKNSEVALILLELADRSELEDDQPYRARAYRKAALTVQTTEDDIEKVWKEGRLRELPGVGENIERKIDEILKTGKLTTLEKLKQKYPLDVKALTSVEGVGPKTVRSLYEEFKIHNLDEFETAVREGRLHGFKGLGVKSDRLLLERIDNAKLQTHRILLSQAQELAKRLTKTLASLEAARNFAITGSYRRMKETIGDFDVLIESSNPSKSIEALTKSREVSQVMLSGELKTSVKVGNNFQVDVRIVPAKSWGAALMYFTGSKPHNIELRTRAISMGFRLNEYGLYRAKTEEMVAGESEEQVYSALGLDYIVPELRENRGEIQHAESCTLPNLLHLEDIKGDLQMHTEWSDGLNSIETMAEEGRKMGYEYIALTDHVGSLKIANALDKQRVREQGSLIEKLNAKYEKQGVNFHILHGAEVNIRADGIMDLPNVELKQFDIVLGSIHSGFSDEEGKITSRLIGAMENEYVDIIAHPTGRLLLERLGYNFDLRKVTDKALETGTVLEIDSHANRLDLSDEKAMQVIRAGCRLSIDTDAHSFEEMAYEALGVAQARRAWAEKKDVLNTLSYEELVRFLDKRQ